MKYIRRMACRMDARKRRFRHYMAQIGAIFPPKSGLGLKIPWDGSANPWDGNLNPWDGSTEQPHGRTKISLKGGRRWASALTLCHIAHRSPGIKKAARGGLVEACRRRASGGHVDGVASLPFFAGGGVVDVGAGLDVAAKALFVAQAVPWLDAGERHVLALRRP